MKWGSIYMCIVYLFVIGLKVEETGVDFGMS